MAPTHGRIVPLHLPVVGALMSAAVAHADGGASRLALHVPSDVRAGEDATFRATVQPETTGTVSFAVVLYSGEVLWTGRSEIHRGEAAVTVAAGELRRLAKGDVVVSAALDDQITRAPICLRGRRFTDVTRAPKGIRPGDEFLITDMSMLRQADAVSKRGERGKWWLRQYRDENGVEGALLAVEAQDILDPESTLAPPVELPLELRGWYEIWVLTYRHPEQGGIDVRLSDEPYFRHCDPNQSPQPSGRLVEVRFRAADLTGQSLVFQQPFGTYDSSTVAAIASVAGVRLVKLSTAQVERLKAERKSPKILAFDNDGFSYFWRWGVHDARCIGRLLEPLRDGSAAFLNIELGGLGGITIPTPYTGMYQMTGHTRRGDYRANDFFRWCFENDVNILEVLTERAHELGLELFASLMAERSFSRDETMRAHPEWMIQRGPGTWDYALPQVQAYQVEKIRWIMANHDLDGFIVDFTRYGHFFNEDEPDKSEHMNQFLRDLRRATDDVNARKTCPVKLCASFGDESWHLKHWGTGKLADQGLDPKTWIDEGILDIIMPEGPTMMQYVEMARGSSTEVWPRKVRNVTFKDHRHVRDRLGPVELERGIGWALDGGAPGVFMFNHEPITALERVGYRDERDLRAELGQVYGLREGPALEFDTWHPDLMQMTKQRESLRPVTTVADARRRVDSDAIVRLRNTFAHPVTARVMWSAAQALDVDPSSDSIHLAAGSAAVLPFHATGLAATHDAAPRATVEFLSGDLAILRHELPLRAVPDLPCPHVDVTPLSPQTVFDVATGGPSPSTVCLSARYDSERLHLACEITGIDVTAISRERSGHDSRGVAAKHDVHFLIDPAGAEKMYMGFAAEPGGGTAEYLSRHDPFAGHVVRKLDWDAEWTAEARFLEDGYHIEAAIPLSTLGARPAAGDVWRFNVVVHLTGSGGNRVALSWSASDVAFHLPRDLGTVFGTLSFR